MQINNLDALCALLITPSVQNEFIGSKIRISVPTLSLQEDDGNTLFYSDAGDGNYSSQVTTSEKVVYDAFSFFRGVVEDIRSSEDEGEITLDLADVKYDNVDWRMQDFLGESVSLTFSVSRALRGGGSGWVWTMTPFLVSDHFTYSEHIFHEDDYLDTGFSFTKEEFPEEETDMGGVFSSNTVAPALGGAGRKKKSRRRGHRSQRRKRSTIRRWTPRFAIDVRSRRRVPESSR